MSEDVNSQLCLYLIKRSHFQINIVGRCSTGRQNDRPHDSHLYKFYLSFENTLCEDYVTEKFYRPLEQAILPIVMG